MKKLQKNPNPKTNYKNYMSLQQKFRKKMLGLRYFKLLL